MKSRYRKLLLINIMVPLIVGGGYYCLFCPGTFISDLNPFNLCISMGTGILRNYGCDFLWAYAFVFAIAFFSDIRIREIVAEAFIFYLVTEVLQLFLIINGTFDLMDIIIECLAGTIAGVIIFLWRKRDEI